MERRITRRQALGAGAALLAAPRALTALGELAAAAPAAAATTKAAVAVTPSMTEGPYWIDEMLRRFDVRANTSTASSAAGVAQAGVPLALKINVLDAAERRRDQRRPRRHLARQRGRPLLRRGQQTWRRDPARTSCAATRSPASMPAPARRRSTGRSTSRRSGRAGTPAARSTSTCASAPTTAARSRPTTRPRSSSPTPTTTRFCRARRPTTRARRRPIRRPTRPTWSSSRPRRASDEHRLRHRQHRRRLRRDVHDRPQRRRLERRRGEGGHDSRRVDEGAHGRQGAERRPLGRPRRACGRDARPPLPPSYARGKTLGKATGKLTPGWHSLRVTLPARRRGRRRDGEAHPRRRCRQPA